MPIDSKKKVQINITVPIAWKSELENLARIYSVEEGKTITFLDLMRRGILPSASTKTVSRGKMPEPAKERERIFAPATSKNHDFQGGRSDFPLFSFCCFPAVFDASILYEVQ